MKKYLAILGLAVMIIPTLALAAVLKEEANVNQGETVQGNLYLAGSSPLMAGTVQGDLVTAGGNVVVTGTVTQDLLVAGGNINVTGKVNGDLRAFGGNIYLDGQIDGELFVAGGQVTIGSNAVVRGDLNAMGGTVKVDGEAKIYGKKTVQTGEDEKSGSGEITQNYFDGGFWTGKIIGLLAAILIAVLAFGIFPKVTQKGINMALVKGDFWKNLGLGFLLLIAMPIVAIICFFTMVGALLGVIILMCYIVTLIVSAVFSGVVLGTLLNRLFNKNKKLDVSWLWLVIGIVALNILGMIPFVGWIIVFVFMLLTLGTMCKFKWQIARSIR